VSTASCAGLYHILEFGPTDSTSVVQIVHV
jgi:hypothetical protein